MQGHPNPTYKFKPKTSFPPMRYRRTTLAGATYFFTLVTHERSPIFADGANVAHWRDAVAKVQRDLPFIIESEVILPDYLHMIWSLTNNDADYATRIRLIKTAFTKALPVNATKSPTQTRTNKGERTVWQRRYWEHTIRDERDFQVHADYIHFNLVKHGLAAKPADWPHSTFKAWVER
jgi:putative transposase